MQPFKPGAREEAQLVKEPGASESDHLDGFPCPAGWKERMHCQGLASDSHVCAIACMHSTHTNK